MRVIDKADAGVHYQKPELRNDYNRILQKLVTEDKLFIDDRNSRSVAVMISYRFYKNILAALDQVETLQDELDHQTAKQRASDGSKPLSYANFKKLLNKNYK